jgi:hypothetical protein
MWVVVQFDCAEAVLAEVDEFEDAWDLRDDFDCAPQAVYLSDEVEITDCWDKNGWTRVNYRKIG